MIDFISIDDMMIDFISIQMLPHCFKKHPPERIDQNSENISTECHFIGYHLQYVCQIVLGKHENLYVFSIMFHTDKAQLLNP